MITSEFSNEQKITPKEKAKEIVCAVLFAAADGWSDKIEFEGMTGRETELVKDQVNKLVARIHSRYIAKRD